MNYSNNSWVVFSPEELSIYINKMVNKVFAILGIYEDCEKISDFDTYKTYVQRVIVEMVGFSRNYPHSTLVSLVNILTGIMETKNLTHKQVKSIIFHTISSLKKMG